VPENLVGQSRVGHRGDKTVIAMAKVVSTSFDSNTRNGNSVRQIAGSHLGTAFAKTGASTGGMGGLAMDERARLGSTVVIKGELTAHEDVVIAGRLEGSIHVIGHLVVVEAGARVVGDITATGIVVTGTVKGSLIAEERIQIRDGADLQGDASAPRVVVTDGAVVNGRIETEAPTNLREMKAAS
jgi:cytoskeletal protein CcmA (bactofilin family)